MLIVTTKSSERSIDITEHGYVSTVKRVFVESGDEFIFTFAEVNSCVGSPVTIALIAPLDNNERISSGGDAIGNVFIDSLILNLIRKAYVDSNFVYYGMRQKTINDDRR